MATVNKEAYPLAWPSGWPRTRPQDRRKMPSWKRTANEYREDVLTELGRMKSPNAVISTNVPIGLRGDLKAGGVEPFDVGVAVYFSRPGKEDFSWQAALQITNIAGTEEAAIDQVKTQYRELANLYHPDRPGGDPTMFAALTRHRDNALAWIERRSGKGFQSVIAADLFIEVRWNLAAIAQSLKSIRQLERCGTSEILERTFKGFEALPEHVEAR